MASLRCKTLWNTDIKNLKHFLKVIKMDSLLRLCILLCSLSGIFCNICKFHHLRADCRYRVDGISMIHIVSTINQCKEPVDITFTLKCNEPNFKLDWSYTFNKIDETVDIPGFDIEVELRVQHGYRDGNKYTINADFIREDEQTGTSITKFMSEEINLIPDAGCVALTNESIIAISVLVPIFVLATIALVVVLIIWRRRVNQSKLNSQTLVNNGESPSTTTPPVIFQNGSVSIQGSTGTLDTAERQTDFSILHVPG